MRIIGNDTATSSQWQERDRAWSEANPDAKWRLRRAFPNEYAHRTSTAEIVAILDVVRKRSKRLRTLVVVIDDRTRARIPIAIDKNGDHWTIPTNGDSRIPVKVESFDKLAARIASDEFVFRVPTENLTPVELGDACFQCAEPFGFELTAVYETSEDRRHAHVACATVPKFEAYGFVGVTLHIPNIPTPPEGVEALMKTIPESVTLFGETFRSGLGGSGK